MKIIIVDNYLGVGAKGAEIVAGEINKNKKLVLGLATGETMIPFYRSLIKMAKSKKINIKGIKTFNLDEYAGFGKDNKDSYYHFMDKNFFSKVGIPAENVNFLNGKNKNLNLECKNYEKMIKKFGGIDLQVLGIGRDGHIGFNEPGSKFNSKTRMVLLSKLTRKDNSRFFGHKLERVPKKSLTMGISTIMSARKILLLASGANKAEIIHRALHGEVNAKVPASFLQRHKNVIVILDKDAGSELD
ncbi:MAG: glucosamine-6-phosphate deaminase [Nanoarchaeota archaeon]|nr:glucosamine-6-phosphate deaminase [Nanoarchaeota archaeon]